MNFLTMLFGNYSKKEISRINPIIDKIDALRSKYENMSDSELRSQTNILKDRLKNGETLDDILPDAFSVCSQAAWRVLGERPYRVQLIGGVILHQGRISEMKTGEGKTLTSTLPAYLNALSENGVHIVTVNEYLAKVGTDLNGKVFRFLGLTVGNIYSGLQKDERRKAYACDITYGTNNEFGFDYLRDNMVTYKANKVQRGHNFAIVDEVDSILIDEARTPLIISGKGAKSSDLYDRANTFARSLKRVMVGETDNKEDNDEIYDEYDYIVNEKAKTATLTKRGVTKAEAFFALENLTDPDNVTIQHHINQAIKAYGTMKRDTNYLVKDGEVIIIDEFTGRLMYGRRYNEGLHQAIEAKEGVTVANENKTLATITFQNYFRLYKKLSGMTGTALTEESEFGEIYKLDVIEVPTNKPMVREDCADVVYKTEKAKYTAVIDDIEEHYKTGQPVLVGTVTVEKSEMLSQMLKRRGIKHEVLNAKYHDKEAEIIAQAGKKGAITIATNMAGRGTDIKLGGNLENLAISELRKSGMEETLIVEATGFAETDNEEILEARKTFAQIKEKYKPSITAGAEEVKGLGGLYIIGTERHESRRIDNQLRGRAGRQGDPGKTRFYLSLEDDLMRLFGGEKIQNLMTRMNVADDLPIEAKVMSNTIEGSQKKVEGRNFGIRKNVLQYDDVMNHQREIIYDQRNKVLNGDNVKDQILKMIEEDIELNVDLYLPKDVEHKDWNIDALKAHYLGWVVKTEDLVFTKSELEELSSETVKTDLKDKAMQVYKAKEEEIKPELMREVERTLLLRNVDTLWMDHIDAMEELKNGIRLRAYAQKDPVIEYKSEGFDMFDQMIAIIRENTAKMVLTVRLRTKEAPKREEIAKETSASSSDSSEPKKKKPIVNASNKVGRNEPCPCGSGLKYKKCCGKNQ
ncbi:MAG: preprotein translocase subunit SecA [Clostridia bacterium]